MVLQSLVKLLNDRKTPKFRTRTGLLEIRSGNGPLKPQNCTGRVVVHLGKGFRVYQDPPKGPLIEPLWPLIVGT